MRTRIYAALNGIPLNSLDSAIVIQGVDEAAPNWNISAGNRAGLTGQIVLSTEKRYRDVKISFAIAEKHDLIHRAQILQQVNAWAAGGGVLEVGYRPGQLLRVICAGLPEIKTLTKWAEAYSITFRAYEVPFWVSTVEESVSVAATSSGSGALAVTGTAGGKLCFTATNGTSSSCATVSVSANGATMAFSSLGLAAGEKLIVDYDERDLQRIRIQASGGTLRSVMDKRTVESADDIPLLCGGNTITVTAQQNLTWKLYTIGRWE